MRTLAEHHWSAEMLLTFSIIAGLTIGGLLGWGVGMTTDNIGAGISIGVLIGLVAGLSIGILVSDRNE
ncbi:hypothetical protein LLG96_04880 [bacterium]|nr:hypothetical protein [bacterium]